AALVAAAQPRESTTFVFVPNNDAAPKPPDRGAPSDMDRVARARERAEKPDNPLPFSRGNSPERIDQPPREAARGRGPQPEPQPGPPSPEPQEPQTEPPPQRLPESASGLVLPPPTPQTLAGNAGRSTLPGGQLGKALANLDRYTRNEIFRNP